jgi:hypothetical protein
MKVSSLKQPLKGSKFLTETIRNIFSPFFSHTPRRVQIRARAKFKQSLRLLNDTWKKPFLKIPVVGICEGSF